MKMNLISLQDARDQVNLDDDLDERTLEQMRTTASGIIVDYLKLKETGFLDDTSFNWVDNFGEPIEANIPDPVIAATKLVLGALYENRDGDAWRAPQPLSQAVIDILMRRRDPAMA